jgi:hypothetical protein
MLYLNFGKSTAKKKPLRFPEEVFIKIVFFNYFPPNPTGLPTLSIAQRNPR